MKDLYETLGLKKGAAEADIKRAYRKLAAQYHPDVNKDKGAEAKFKEVQNAYEILSDPQKRAQYDQFGSVGGGGGGGFGGGGFGGFQDMSGFDFSGGLGDIFETFFGGGGGMGGQKSRKMRDEPGRTLRTTLNITLEEAFKGAKKHLQIETFVACAACDARGHEKGSKFTECAHCHGTGQIIQRRATPLGYIQTSGLCGECGGRGQKPEKACRECHGAGRVMKSQEITIEVPPGVANGTTLRVSGKGEAGERGAKPGDLLVQIHVAPSKKFEREGDDIHAILKIHALEAVLGNKVEIETLHGKTTLKIASGTQPNQVLRLKEKGMPHLGKAGFGDHFVHIKVEVPKKLSNEEKKRYGELAQKSGLKIETEKGFLEGLF